MKAYRTDLAVELNRLHNPDSGLSGVSVREEKRGGFSLTTVDIGSEEASKVLCKPIGKYSTLELGAFIRREENSFEEAVAIFAEELKNLLALEENDSVMVVGLGNRAITPDAVGPASVDGVLATRHLRERSPEHFAHFREVCAFSAGVLGTTGIESADMIGAVCTQLRPACVIAVDALAALEVGRLCRTVQFADSGIVPGSGIGNGRAAINRETLGVPVIAVGAPTVVDAGTLVHSLLQSAGAEPPELKQHIDSAMIVTPKDIDKNIADISKIIAYGINLALHDGLSVADIDMLIG